MRETRGASQIFFNFLPHQTVDLANRVWKVRQWVEPVPLPVDRDALRRALMGAAKPWRGNDNGLNRWLERGRDIEVRRLNEFRGVEVEPFPEQFRCKACGRITNDGQSACACGNKAKAQLHFVAYHQCGAVGEPFVPKCPQHGASAVRLPGTASSMELKFFCPKCKRHLRNGFTPRFCDCGITGDDKDMMGLTVHRAGVVYTPRFTTLVNSPDPTVNARLRAAGGAARALEWALEGMKTVQPGQDITTYGGEVARLMSEGRSRDTAERMAQIALEAGEITRDQHVDEADIPAKTLEDAQEEAISVASAMADGKRLRVADLQSSASGALKSLYEETYPAALDDVRLNSVALIEDFPVVNMAFGYTRGDIRPGRSRLISFRSAARIRVYGSMTETEALLFQFDPVLIHRWLTDRGHLSGRTPESRREAHLAILREAVVPHPADEDPQQLGSDLLQVIHSYSHRAIRLLAAFAGTERDSLGEYLLPHLCSFVIYANSQGFVLGGLRSVLENTLDQFLAQVLESETRCPLDPGCRTGGGACMACLHLGERSCQLFNQFLHRDSLFGDLGFLSADGS